MKTQEEPKTNIENKAVLNRKHKVSESTKKPSSSSKRHNVPASQTKRRSNRDASKNASLINSFIVNDVYELEKKGQLLRIFIYKFLINYIHVLLRVNKLVFKTLKLVFLLKCYIQT